LSILEMRSPEMVRDVFVFILPLYYQGGILATNGRSTSWVALTSNGVDLSGATGAVTFCFSR
jgi:hypothetical protein